MSRNDDFNAVEEDAYWAEEEEEEEDDVESDSAVYDQYDFAPARQKPKGAKPMQKTPATNATMTHATHHRTRPDYVRHTQRSTCPAQIQLAALLRLKNPDLQGHAGIKDVDCYREKLENTMKCVCAATNGDSQALLPQGCNNSRPFDPCPYTADDFLASAREHPLHLQISFDINGHGYGESLAVWIEVRCQDCGDYQAYWIWIAVSRVLSDGDTHHPFFYRDEWLETSDAPQFADGEIVAVNPATTAMIKVMANPRCAPAYRARLWGAMGNLWD